VHPHASKCVFSKKHCKKTEVTSKINMNVVLGVSVPGSVLGGSVSDKVLLHKALSLL